MKNVSFATTIQTHAHKIVSVGMEKAKSLQKMKRIMQCVNQNNKEGCVLNGI
jgi:hypothetical protein